MVEVFDGAEVDAWRLYDIYRISRKAAGFERTSQMNFEDFQADLEQECVLLVYDKDGVAGFLSIYSPQNFIHHFYILPEYQGVGLGGELFDQVVKNFEAPLSLKCESWNAAALNFYKKRGWEEFSQGVTPSGIAYYQLIFGLE